MSLTIAAEEKELPPVVVMTMSFAFGGQIRLKWGYGWIGCCVGFVL